LGRSGLWLVWPGKQTAYDAAITAAPGVRLWHQRDSRDARNAVIAADLITFRLGGFPRTPVQKNHHPNFLQRHESLSTVFSAALMRHRMGPAPPHRDINQTSMNTTRRQRLRAAPSLQARFAFPAPRLGAAAEGPKNAGHHAARL
jgi:hypothetical protein